MNIMNIDICKLALRRWTQRKQ